MAEARRLCTLLRRFLEMKPVMDNPPPQDFDAWNDPEFSIRWAMREKPASSSSLMSAENNQSGRREIRSRWRTRSLFIALLVIWMELLLDPTIGRMLWDAALGFGITLGGPGAGNRSGPDGLRPFRGGRSPPCMAASGQPLA